MTWALFHTLTFGWQAAIVVAVALPTLALVSAVIVYGPQLFAEDRAAT